MNEPLEDKIEEFACWTRSTKLIYVDSAKKLIELGMTEDNAIKFLYDLYNAAAEDFGGNV